MSPSPNIVAAPSSLMTASAGQNPILSEAPAPVAPSLSAPASNLLDVKDQRAFEHDRQRAHKPVDRRKRYTPPNPTHKHIGNAGRSTKPNPGYRAGLNIWKGQLFKSDLDAASEGDYYDEEEEDAESEAEQARPLHVSLSDLIRPERKRNGTIIPPSTI